MRLVTVLALVGVAGCSHAGGPGGASDASRDAYKDGGFADSGAAESAPAPEGGEGGDANGPEGGRCVDAPDAGGDAGAMVCSGSVCFDPNWAQWPMPSSPVEVAAGAPNAESYTINGDGTVTDDVTGLMWEQTERPGTLTWAAALSYCTGLALAGHSDWRAPAYIELLSIVDYARKSPVLDPSAFPGASSADFWSSTPLAGSSPPYAWEVYFSAGDASQDDALTTNSVRCVRLAAPLALDASAPPSGRYTIANGAVYDPRTKLTWQEAASLSPLAWADAKAYCTGLSLNGPGWRLPTVGELMTLVDVERGSPPGIDCSAFPDGSSNDFWSATATAALASNAWAVRFELGDPRTLDVSSANYVRCVR